MGSRSGAPPAPEAIAGLLGPVLGAGAVEGLERLSGGASRETWAFRYAGRDLILRRDPPGRPSAPGVMAREAAAMRACRAAGLVAPEVLAVDDGSLLGTAGLVMGRVAGETIARRILRDEPYAVARTRLVGQYAAFLAGLHGLDPATVDSLVERDAFSEMVRLRGELDEPSPVLDRAFEWLREHQPAPSATCVVHGDFRLGNVIVDGDGLAAVIDWELVHLGDPLEDLAWLCLKAWRFGAPGEVGGLGSIEELVAAYEAAGGGPVDRAALHWWLVNRTVLWGLGCLKQGAVHRSGAVRSVELALVGRRVAEQEWDLIELLAPSAVEAARAAPMPPTVPDQPGRFGVPTARELIEAVREFLSTEVTTVHDTRVAYTARVAANALAAVERELAMPANGPHGDDWESLALAVRDRLAVVNPAHIGR